MYPYAYLPAPSGPLETLGAPAPVYVILIIGMVLFMASNTMPALLPDPEKIGQVAPMIFQWGFGICLLALLTTMTGLVPGVPQLHITYVHLAIAFIIFFLIWNQVVADIPEEKERSSSSSSSSSSSKKEEKPSEKKESRDKDPEPSSWDDLRAHPSAFLTTRLNRYLPWPFPMGQAAAAGPELWWESGKPAHVGHYNRPDAEVKESEEDRKKRKEKEAVMEKKKENEKEKAQAKAEAEKEAEQKMKRKEVEEAKKKEMERMKVRAAEATRLKAIEDRQKQKLWRTKYLAMIIGIGLVNRTLGFLLLLFFSIQLVSQELNAKPIPEAPKIPASTSSRESSSSRPEPRSSSSDSKPSSSNSDAEKAKRAKLEAMKKQQEERAKDAKKSSSSSSSRSESSGSRSQESSPSSKESSSSSRSSSSKSDVVSSAAIREAVGSTTVTGIDPDASIGVPYNLGFGMHYIHTRGEKGDLDIQPAIVASQGIAHPLMSSTYKGWAN